MSNCMGKQAIHCDVTDCAFNEERCRCGLEAIQVCTCGANGTEKRDQSMCDSYRCR